MGRGMRMVPERISPGRLRVYTWPWKVKNALGRRKRWRRTGVHVVRGAFRITKDAKAAARSAAQAGRVAIKIDKKNGLCKNKRQEEKTFFWPGL